MFIFRKITSEGLKFNMIIGDTYLVVDREKHPDDFNGLLKNTKWNEFKLNDEVYGFLTHHDGSEVTPLYSNATYFIMTSDGNIFENISKE